MRFLNDGSVIGSRLRGYIDARRASSIVRREERKASWRLRSETSDEAKRRRVDEARRAHEAYQVRQFDAPPPEPPPERSPPRMCGSCDRPEEGCLCA